MNVEQALDHLLERSIELEVDLDILAVAKKSTSISFQQRKMDQFAFSETQQIGVRVLDGAHEGVAYSESLTPASLDEMFEEARKNSLMIRREWPSELRPATSFAAMPELYNVALEEVALPDKIQAAKWLEEAALDFDQQIRAVAYTGYRDVSATVWVANSQGLRGSYRQNHCSGSTYCLATDGDNNVMDGFSGLQRDFAALDTAAIAREAAQRTLNRRGAVRPKTGKYTVVFRNRAAEDLLSFVCDYFSAKAVDEGKSVLKGKLGEAVFSPLLSLLDDPYLNKGVAARPFDDEGCKSLKTSLVEKGVLKAFLTNSVLARKMGLPLTASASRSPSTELDISPSNIVVQAGSSTFEDLLGADSKVVLVSDISGSAGFRPSSGDFSLPMEGFLYENGQRTLPLKDFMISGNIMQLMRAVNGVGNDVLQPIGTVICPSLMIPDLNVVGQS
jgi:PmbA protein